MHNKTAVFIAVSVLILSTVLYNRAQNKIPEKIARSELTMRKADSMRFAYKAALVIEKGMTTYSLALKTHDRDLVDEAADHFEAAQGFFDTAELANHANIATLNRQIKELKKELKICGLQITDAQLTALYHRANDISHALGQIGQDVWVGFQKEYIAFQTAQYELANLYKITLGIASAFMLLMLWMFIRQRRLIVTIRSHETDLQRLAYFDQLTEIPNRKQIETLIAQKIEYAKRHAHTFYVTLLDLDNFKKINDLHGHESGDTVLIEIAGRIRGAIRTEDQVGRFGGDEFLIVFDSSLDASGLATVLERIKNRLKTPIRLHTDQYFSTISMGVARYPNDGSSLTELIKNADIAMFEAKKKGRNQYRFFDASLGTRIAQEYVLESEIIDALAHRQFELYFQPLIDTQTGTIVSAEALVRWNHPDKGLVPPAYFIRTIEQGCRTKEFGEWVIEAAAHAQKKWRAQGIDIAVSVNLSVKHIISPNFFEEMLALVRGLQIDLKTFIFEITEYELMEYRSSPLETLNRLADAGFIFHLDDFGTGYSSITYLHHLPIKALKIDKSFIDKISPDNSAKLLVDAIFNMAGALEIALVAEGVENDYQFEYLQTLGCTHIQGYYFSPPLQNDAFIEYAHRSIQNVI